MIIYITKLIKLYFILILKKTYLNNLKYIIVHIINYK